MVSRSIKRLVLVALLPCVTACGSSIRNQARTTAAPLPVQLPTPLSAAPIETALSVAPPALASGAGLDGQIEAGTAVRMTASRLEFDYESQALDESDGIADTPSEPASLDELLAMSTTLTEPISSELEDVVIADLETGDHDLPIPLNQRVLAFIELFQGRLHDFLLEGMRRGSEYLPMIQNVFRAEGLPLDLAYVPLVESAFKPTALSRAKARGVWQFMSGTGKDNGLRQDWFVDERSDPEKSTVAAARYLSTLAQMFDGDWHLALASYNGGPGRLQHAIKAGGAADFWTLAANPKLLPRETRDYVPMILAAVIIARNPAQYGFEFDPKPPYQYDRVVLNNPVDLHLVAEWTETSVAEIQQLNPELRRWTTPARTDSYELKVPVGTGTAVEEQLSISASMRLASLDWYTARQGDTLALVAKKLGVAKTDLAAANDLASSARLIAGQKLIVPREAKAQTAARTAAQTSAPAVDLSNASLSKVSYQVKPGDTLSSIARVFSTNVTALMDWNHLTSSAIREGARLTIYTAIHAN